MNTSSIISASFPRIAAALVAGVLSAASLSSCSTGVKGTQSTAVYETKNGIAVVDVFQANATVTAIDADKRKLKLILSDGKRTTVKCGPEVVNFNRINVNDLIQVTIAEEYAVSLGKEGSPSASGKITVALAEAGAKPGAATVETITVKARVQSIDAAKRKVTLEFPEGKTKTVKVEDSVDLARVSPGDIVTVVYSEAIAVTVTTP